MYHRKFLEYFGGDPYLAVCINDLGRVVEEVLEYLDEQGIPAVRIATADIHGSSSIN
ncbi:MAG: hypothetical protein WCY56_01230 [Aminobacteriaceae bacterium]